MQQSFPLDLMVPLSWSCHLCQPCFSQTCTLQAVPLRKEDHVFDDERRHLMVLFSTVSIWEPLENSALKRLNEIKIGVLWLLVLVWNSSFELIHMLKWIFRICTHLKFTFSSGEPTKYRWLTLHTGAHTNFCLLKCSPLLLIPSVFNRGVEGLAG